MRIKNHSVLVAVVLVFGFAAFTSCNKDNPPKEDPTYSTLKEALNDISLFSNIKENPDTGSEFDYKEQYSMFFTQDLDHSDEGGDTFRQKVCILFRGFDRPTIMVTEGYNFWGFRDAGDLGINLNANMVHVEHRNYGESYNEDFGRWEYQTIAQASADLHAVYQALKPIFKGKWMSAGTSKSAETSIAYAYFYPQDMDLAASFCGPFVQGLDDQRFGEYFFNEVGTAEERDLMKTGIRHALENGEEGLYSYVSQQVEDDGLRVPGYSEYVFNVFDTYFQVFQYYTQITGRKQYLEAMAADNEILATEVYTVLEDNRDEACRSYFVECAKEMGWQDNGYKYFQDLLEGTSFNKADVLPQVLEEEDRPVVKTYDGRVYEDIVNRFFFTSTCPLLLVYSHDDPWSAGKPETVGSNVKVVMNPIGSHSPYLNDPDYCSEATKKEVMDWVQTYIY